MISQPFDRVNSTFIAGNIPDYISIKNFFYELPCPMNQVKYSMVENGYQPKTVGLLSSSVR